MNRPKPMTLILSAGVLAGLLAAGSLADARPFGPRRAGGFFGGRMMRVFHDLDLTEQQELQAVRLARALREDAKAARRATRADMQTAAEELKKPSPDRQKLHALVDAAVERFREMAHARVDGALDFHAQLSPEQKAEVARRIERRQARAERRRARMREE